MQRITTYIRRITVKPTRKVNLDLKSELGNRVAYIPGNYLRMPCKNSDKKQTLLIEVGTLVPLIACGAGIVYLIA